MSSLLASSPPSAVPPGRRESSAFRAARWRILFPLLFVGALFLSLDRCANPLDTNSKKKIDPTPIDTTADDPRFDTMRAFINTRIRFEPQIDKSTFLYSRIPDSMRIGIVTETKNDTLPYTEIYSSSAVYLNVGSVALPFEATIDARYFLRWKNARLFLGYIVVYGDANRNRKYDFGETVYGVSEQAAFAFAEGKKLENIPVSLVRGVVQGPNVFVRTGGARYAVQFTAAPDFDATIFKIQIRGSGVSYDPPYPWKPKADLTK
jgi:hypothetical protein